MRFKEINGDLHAGARVFGGRVQNVVIPPGQPIAGKGADAIQSVGHVHLIDFSVRAGANGGGDRVGKVGDAEKVQKVKPEGV